jgi:hypothetical protein
MLPSVLIAGRDSTPIVATAEWRIPFGTYSQQYALPFARPAIPGLFTFECRFTEPSSPVGRHR